MGAFNFRVKFFCETNEIRENSENEYPRKFPATRYITPIYVPVFCLDSGGTELMCQINTQYL